MGGKGSGARNPRTFKAAGNTKPWERQPRETDPAWRAFVLYRDGGLTRSAERVRESLGKRPGYMRLLAKWSGERCWRERVEAWDAHVDEVRREAELEAQREASRDMVKRQLAAAADFQRYATVEMRRHLNAIAAVEGDVDMTKTPTAKLDEVRTLFDFGARLERLNRGQPERVDEIVTTDGGDASDSRRSWTDLVNAAALEDEESGE